MNKFQIVSGYTKNTPYEKEVQNLKASLDKFGFSCEHVVGFENLGTWEKNCQQKALILKSKLQELKTPIVWLDADAVLKKNPVLFYEIEKDIAFCYYRIAGKDELLSGTIFLKPSEISFKILDEWIKLNNQNPKEWDQRTLQKIIKNFKIDYYNLPPSYCKIDYIKCDEIVIGQNQSSRRFKSIINADEEIYKRYSEYNVSLWENLKIVYWAIPKSGSTTIKNHLLNLNSGIVLKNPLQVHDQQYQKIIKPEYRDKYFNFSLVRNPISRFCSMYQDFFVYRQKNNMYFPKELNKDWKALDFAKYLLETEDKQLNIHFKSFSFFLKDKRIKIFTLENLKEDWSIDIPAPDKKMNTRSDNNFTICEDTVALIKARYSDDFLIWQNKDLNF
jgi:hypothetical protein